MAVDPSVITALEAALASAPESVGVRLHLAELLLESGAAADAMQHCAAVLAHEPDNAAALALAARAADEAGDADRAGRYRRLHDALVDPLPQGTAPEEPPAAAIAEPAGELGVQDDVDAFLDDVLGRGDDVGAQTVMLADVGGLDAVKLQLQTSFLGPMRNPELRRMYGTSLRGGLLLYGPPGCGKTFLARAVAGELGAHFFAIGLHESLDMWLGQSERNLHALFETARRRTPCVLFLDEVDALGQRRSQLSHSAGRNVVVQLLTELDSARNDNEGLFVLGATNQPWDVDPALRRPGRFDRMLLVLPPDEAARRVILQYHLRNRPLGAVDVGRLAKRTDGYSGADLRLVCDAAAEAALAASVATGSARPIETRDLERALQQAAASTRPWFEVAKNYALFANDGGTYDELLGYMRSRRLC